MNAYENNIQYAYEYLVLTRHVDMVAMLQQCRHVTESDTDSLHGCHPAA
jgi:hypothetical protein